MLTVFVTNMPICYRLNRFNTGFGILCNITQRDTDYYDTREGIALARQWLTSGSSNVKQFNKTLSTRGRLGEGRPKETDSCRSIANFLSKNGKAISYGTVKNYLDVTDKHTVMINNKK